MHNARISTIIVLTTLSLTALMGFEDKFSEKNQTGSPSTGASKPAAPTNLKSNKSGPTTKVKRQQIEEPELNAAILEPGPLSEDRRRFDQWYEQLQDKIRNKKSVKERVDTLHEGLAQIEKDRDKLQNLKFNEEIEIDFLIKPLKLLPKVSQFKVENCFDYKMKILSHFDPTSEDDVKDPSLKKALGVFKLICTN